MITAAIVLFILSIFAAIAGFGGFTPDAANTARTLFYVLLVFSAALMIIGVIRKPPRV
jgi:uncharacterized membrane protein YtjA (UPF0391 family)